MVELLTKLGDAVLKVSDKKNAADKGADGAKTDFYLNGGDSGATETVAAPKDPPSTSAQAFTQMLRRHDERAKRISSDNENQTEKNSKNDV